MNAGQDSHQENEDMSAAAAEAAPEWLANFRRSPHQRGFYVSGEGYGVLFTDRGEDVLVVSCDNLSSAREDTLERSPWGYSFVAKNGWSQLGIMAFRPDWFRNDALHDYLHDLAASGFFRRFSKVVMTGTSMGGYAATAFASLAPGCTVLAFSPQSTLKADLVPWETRFASGRRADWNGAFADGAVESRAAKQVFLVYDPRFQPDVDHANRYDAPNVVRLAARYSGHKTALFLRRAGLLSTAVRSAVTGELSLATFHHIYRGGRVLPWYLHAVQARLLEGGHHHLLPRFSRAVRKMGNIPLARSAEGHAIEAGIIDKTASPAPSAGTPSMGPHQRRLAAQRVQAASAIPPKPQAPPRERKHIRSEKDGTIDFYQTDATLPPLLKTDEQPWQAAQAARRSDIWATRPPRRRD